MPESNQMSRKRIRSASEILTKRKLQNQGDGSGGFASLCGKIDSKIIRTYPHATIKDLRLRRVFSPSSVSSDWEFKTKVQNPSKEQNEEAAERICEESNGSAVTKASTNLCRKSVLHPCSRELIFKNPSSFGYRRLLPYLMLAADDRTSSGQCLKPEKPFNQNPPNINLSCNKETVETAEEPKEEVTKLMTAKRQLPETIKPVSQSVDRVFLKPSIGSLSGKTSPLKNVTVSSPTKKSVCSRRKLFKTPGSVNYRRMLPYLKDIQEDNPRVPEVVNNPGHENVNNPSSMLVSDNEETPETSTSNVVEESDTCSHGDKEPVPCEVSVFPEQSDLEKEQEAQVKHVIPDTEKNLRTLHDVLATDVPASSPLVGSITSSEVASSALNNTFVENLLGEENRNDSEKTEPEDSAEQQEADSSNLTTELLDPSVVLGTPSSISPSKGILKRSLRGCRGICSCLNCTSFRLNADRAFEFSRNQLQDTEVMVLDLVGEISHLKAMLENFDPADHNESNKSQAGEAAKRAHEAAELAKSRLHLMNNDLQVHCRIPNEQRARVKFSHHVHEKTKSP